MARILVVDNLLDWRKTLKGLLEDEGYQVNTAKNETEALTQITRTSFDLAIVDFRLHGDEESDESGLSLALALKKLSPHMKIILLTGFTVRTDQVVKSIKFVGVEHFVQKKPINGKGLEDLLPIVKKILNEPSFEIGLDQLSLSLEPNQPIIVRSRGSHVCARRTNNPLHLSPERYNRRAQDIPNTSSSRFNVKDIGEALYREVFQNFPEVLTTFASAAVKSKSLCISFEGSRDLAGVPFEFIFLDQPEDYLVLKHPVTRLVNNVVPTRQALSAQTFAQLKKALCVLIVASNTGPPLIPGVDQEVQQLVDFFNQQDYVDVEVVQIPTQQATASRIRRELRNCEADIVHYAGHGYYDKKTPEQSALFFWSKENSKGNVETITAAELKGLLQDSEVQLAYFSCCFGTASGAESDLLDGDFLGIADAVIQSGTPSVLGFRWPVSDAGAPKLAIAFYESLFKQGNPQIALWEARRELAGALGRDDHTWLSPILIHQV